MASSIQHNHNPNQQQKAPSQKTTEERKMEKIQPHKPQRLVTLKQRNEKCVHHEIFSLRSTKITQNPLISNLEQAAKTRESNN
jgi:hypothetical protein